MELDDDTRAWMKALGKELPAASRWEDAKRILTYEERDRIFATVESCNLLTSMFSKGMFGGFGISIYEHPVYPGAPPTRLLWLTEDNLPPPSRFDRVGGKQLKRTRPGPGCGFDDAWELFSKYTHSTRNHGWLVAYRMDLPQDRSYYDY